jgi:predicted RNA-binding protein YlqC (UPF0109 family)
MMKELLLYIVKNLVENPDAVSVNEVEKENALVLELTVDPSDMGRVIGKQGRIAKAIRTLIRSASAREPKKVLVEILG